MTTKGPRELQAVARALTTVAHAAKTLQVGERQLDRAIVSAHRAGASTRQIAEAAGKSHTVVARIVKGEVT